MKVSKALVGAFVVALAACSSAPQENAATSSSSIIGGQGDSGDPSVVLMNASDGNTGWWCTGSVIAKRVVLTAAHCVEDATSGTKIEVLFGENPIQGKASARIAVSSFHHDPLYLADNNIAAGHDAAVLILASDAPTEPLAINTTPLTQAMVGGPLYVVGYGNDNGQAGTGAGVKRSVHTRLTSLEQGVANIGGTGQTTCQGDSGGPSFMDVSGKSVIIGITSYGEEGCVSYGSVTRVDLAKSFIQPYIDANGGAGTGGADPGTSGGATGGGTGGTGGGTGGTSGGGGTGGGDNGDANPACVYKCKDYGYAPGQCYQGWYCIPDGEDKGCLGQTTC